MKSEIKKNRFIYPEPWTIISCRDENGKDNALTVGLIANASTDPEIIMIGIKKERYSYHIIDKQEEFVVNIAKDNQKEFIDYFGRYSGRVIEKLSCYNTQDADIINAPLLMDCPVNYECKVIKKVTLASHDLFFGQVVKAHCDSQYITGDGEIDWQKINPLHS